MENKQSPSDEKKETGSQKHMEWVLNLRLESSKALIGLKIFTPVC